MKLLVVLSMLFAAAICHIAQVHVPAFWWDITEDTSYISETITAPEEQDVTFSDSKSKIWFWNFDWAEGMTMTWTDGEGRWTAWIWNSTVLPGLTGAGFLYNVSTENGDGRAGATWIRERDNGPIVWNCFRAGDLAGPLPWMSWHLRIRGALIGFMANGSRWGFMTGTDRIWSHYCNSVPSVGKRYQVQGGREVARHVKKDPSAGTYSFQRNRVRRSPDDDGWLTKIKNFFFTDRSKQEVDGAKAKGDDACQTIWDSVVRFVKWLFGWNDSEGTPGSGVPSDQPPGPGTSETAANQESRKDRETLDPKQNEAVPDWE